MLPHFKQLFATPNHRRFPVRTAFEFDKETALLTQIRYGKHGYPLNAEKTPLRPGMGPHACVSQDKPTATRAPYSVFFLDPCEEWRVKHGQTSETGGSTWRGTHKGKCLKNISIVMTHRSIFLLNGVHPILLATTFSW